MEEKDVYTTVPEIIKQVNDVIDVHCITTKRNKNRRVTRFWKHIQYKKVFSGYEKKKTIENVRFQLPD